jgi:DNA-binding transcriptional LysR family regulator
VAVNYELLRTFLEVGTAGTFARAASRRHVTPSAISQQIRTLEVQLGLQLFERLGGRARLTEAGRSLLADLPDHFAALDGAVATAREEPGVLRGTIRIGAPGPFSRVWLRPRIIQLMRQHPELVVEVRFEVTSRLVEGLTTGQLDFSVLCKETALSSVELHPIHVEEFIAVASPGYLREHGRPHSAAEFRRHRFIVFDADQAMHAPWWRMVFGQREPLPGQVVARVGSLDEMLALASAGLGITVLPSYFVEGSLGPGSAPPPPLVALTPGGSNGNARRGARNPIYLAWRKGAPATARFQAVRDILKARPG